MTYQFVRSSSWGALLGVVGTFLLMAPSGVFAQEQTTCGPQVKAEIAKILAQDPAQKDPFSKEAAVLQKKIYEKYGYCGTPSPDADKEVGYCGHAFGFGSTSYERMRCCGYHPQKREFSCSIEILQRFGFGSFGADPNGSYENVRICVDLDSDGVFEEVARSRVHLANEIWGKRPPWLFAAMTDVRLEAYEKLASLPLDGRTLNARALLAWNSAPQDCNDRERGPIWGNALQYQIRLDP